MFSYLSFSREKPDQKISLFALLALTLLLPIRVLALSDGELQRAIVDSKTLGDVGASVKTDGTTAVVSTYRAEGDSDNKCKIKAILVAKTLMDRLKTLTLVRFSFFDPDNRDHCIVLDVGYRVIEAFGSGHSSQQQLLDSIHVRQQGASSLAPAGSSKAASDAPSSLGIVIKGHMMLDERKKQLGLIKVLHDSHQNVAAVLKEFQLEDEAEARGDVSALTDHFNLVNRMIEALYSRASKQAVTTSAPVKAGDFQGERTTLWKTLMDMRKAGRATAEIEAEFNSIESYVGKDGEDKELLHEMIGNLYKKMH